ncbi:hypothetical protein M3B46_08040 [Sphingobacterium daejeonense]|uniref:hypothetical protein n=1 Tax=Sphingobacterium daejeonense TaxID=371142 RepID=UPI0021A6D511|nr:hypothetical protein [Sphingobacterium daejeonense]MCT1530939.1 hypothetical protein [Sphingobacterium daejeonense]
MKRLLFLILIVSLFQSCGVRTLETSVSERLSKFAKIDVLGIDKYDFLSEYGDPESKDLEEIEGVLKEDLYYMENIRGMFVLTKVSFLNSKLTSIKTNKIRSFNNLPSNILEEIDKKVNELQNES